MDELRRACAAVARAASQVLVVEDAISGYAAGLPLAAGGSPGADAVAPPAGAPPAVAPPARDREWRAAFWLTMDAINFGSGWFPTLRKRDGRSGYNTIATALAERFHRAGPWSATELAALPALDVAEALGQDAGHELMALYAASLRDLGTHVAAEHGGRFTAVADAAEGSALSLVHHLGSWGCFADRSRYGSLELPFLKRAQIAAADLERAGVARFGDLGRLTMFADNLVPHVLRIDGVLSYAPSLVDRVERGELIAHDSPEEIEIRACAVHAVELIVAARGDTTPAAVDQLLWNRGQQPVYKASPRHRTRCTAY